jgi:hypothetical protein
VISKDEMLPMLIQVCPDFEPTWQAFLVEWQEQDVELPRYVVVADFARHMISKLERRDVGQLPDIFRTIERFHSEGEHYVREAATIGILEQLQNLNQHTGATEPDQFVQYLGTESKRWWDKLIRFWDGDITALQE